MLVMLRRLFAQFRSDRGVTVPELAVTSMLAAIFLGGLGAFAAGAFDTGAFTQGQSVTLNDVRNVMQKIEKEVRGADSITWCLPAGSCLQVSAQTPIRTFRTVRYTLSGTELRREVFDPVSDTWGQPQTMVERVANTAGEPVFSCDIQSTLLRVNVDLHIQPTPRSDGSLNVQTSIRPRNFMSRATCP